MRQDVRRNKTGDGVGTETKDDERRHESDDETGKELM